MQEIKQELMNMSKSTADEFLKTARAEWRRGSNTGTKHAKPHIQSWVPVKAVGFRARTVGTIEVDTVAHCGEKMSGGVLLDLEYDRPQEWLDNSRSRLEQRVRRSS